MMTPEVKTLKSPTHQCQAAKSHGLQAPADRAFMFVWQKEKNELSMGRRIRQPEGKRRQIDGKHGEFLLWVKEKKQIKKDVFPIESKREDVFVGRAKP